VARNALDDALVESTIGVYETELIEQDRRRSWIHHSIGKRSPIEFEEHYTVRPPTPRSWRLRNPEPLSNSGRFTWRRW
jgi:hypothetical protein